MIGVARLLLAAILVTGSKLSWPSFSVEQPIPVTKRPPASSSMPVRPFPDAVVRQNPPDFSWPVATGVGNYEVLLRFPDLRPVAITIWSMLAFPFRMTLFVLSCPLQMNY